MAAAFSIEADSAALRDDATGEIGALAEKATPVAADVLLIEDSEDSGAKKHVQVGSLGGGGLGYPVCFGGDHFSGQAGFYAKAQATADASPGNTLRYLPGVHQLNR